MRLTFSSLFTNKTLEFKKGLVVVLGSDAALVRVIARERFPQLTLLEESTLAEKGPFWAEPGLFDDNSALQGYLLEEVSDALFNHHTFLRNPECFLVAWSTSLRSNSLLVKECQTSATMYVVPCYELSAYEERILLERALKHRGLILEPGDEIPRIPYVRWYDTCEKLGLKAYADKRVSGRHLQDILLDHREVVLSKLTFAFSAPQASEALEILSTACYELGQDPLLILRALLRHFLQLRSFRTGLDEGLSPDSALSQVTPPVFFKEATQFKRCGAVWRVDDLHQALGLLWQGEKAFKQSSESWAWCHTLYELWQLGCQVNNVTLNQ